MAKERRGHGEGAIYQRTDNGLWCSAVDLGYVNGKRKRKYLYGKTRREVQEKIVIALRAKQQGVPLALERQTVAQCTTVWLADVVRHKRYKTRRSYEQLMRLHILPSIGHFQLTKLTPQHVQTMLRAKVDEGLSARTVQRIRDVLRNMLNHAMRWGFVVRNVATLVELPPVEPSDIRPLTPAQAEVFLQTVRGDRLEALYMMALSMGLREGELLGLLWQDVDLEARKLRVVVQMQREDQGLRFSKPKSDRSRREISIPSILIEPLRSHRLRQMEERMISGTRWQEHGLVFSTGIGTPMDQSNLVGWFKAHLKRAGLPDIRFHDLRHTFVSFLAHQGVSDRVTMAVVGHSDIRLTKNVYMHVFDEAKREAANAVDRLLGYKPQED